MPERLTAPAEHNVFCDNPEIVCIYLVYFHAIQPVYKIRRQLMRDRSNQKIFK